MRKNSDSSLDLLLDIDILNALNRQINWGINVCFMRKNSIRLNRQINWGINVCFMRKNSDSSLDLLLDIDILNALSSRLNKYC